MGIPVDETCDQDPRGQGSHIFWQAAVVRVNKAHQQNKFKSMITTQRTQTSSSETSQEFLIQAAK